jgi:hypothetical protein
METVYNFITGQKIVTCEYCKSKFKVFKTYVGLSVNKPLYCSIECHMRAEPEDFDN